MTRGDAERLLRRLILSQYDMSEALASYDRLLELDEFDVSPFEQSVDTSAHLTRMVVAYSRPFSGNYTKADTLRTLPDEMLDAFTAEERKIHDRLVRLRNTEFAHSDAEAAAVFIGLVGKGETRTVSSISRRPRLLFGQGEMPVVGKCIHRLLGLIHEWRRGAEAQILAVELREAEE